MKLSNQEIFSIIQSKVDNKFTSQNYISKLKTLSAKLKLPIQDIINNPHLKHAIEKEYPEVSTRKTTLTSLLAAMKYVDELPSDPEWQAEHKRLKELELAKYKKNEPTEKQKTNYISFDEIQQKYTELSKLDPHKTKKTSLEYILLSLTLHIRPKRADFGAIRIVKDKIPSEGNYICLQETPYLLLRDFKTSSTYHELRENIPLTLYNDIIASIKKHPRRYLFEDKSKKPYNNITYANFVIRSFNNIFGKKVGVTMLRHIYIREKLDFNEMTQEELDEEARLMCHSPDLQRQYRWVIKN